MKSNAQFILDTSVVMEKFNELAVLADTVSYSVKTNVEVAKFLEKTECQFSVHSLQEAECIQDSSRLWFFGQGWNEKEIKELCDKGVSRFVVDNTSDLDTLIAFLDKNDVSCSVLLRMRLKEHTIHTGKHFVFGLFSHQVNELIPKLKAHKNINKVGIHVHRKTQNVSEWSLKEELSAAVTVWDQIDIVNIGGGLPAQYKNFRVEVLDYIFKKIKEVKLWLNEKNVEMIIEPGRFIAAPSIKLEATIVSKYNNNLILDCSVYNAAMDTFIAHNRLLVKDELEKGEPFTIKGCTPDSLDIFRYRVFLENPKVGDKITFLNAGAYNFNTEFCLLPKVPTVIP